MQAKKVFKTNRNRNTELDVMNKHMPTHRSLSISEQFEPGYKITMIPATTGAAVSSIQQSTTVNHSKDFSKANASHKNNISNLYFSKHNQSGNDHSYSGSNTFINSFGRRKTLESSLSKL